MQIDSERLLDPDTLLTDTSERILCLTYTVEFKHGNDLQVQRLAAAEFAAVFLRPHCSL